MVSEAHKVRAEDLIAYADELLTMDLDQLREEKSFSAGYEKGLASRVKSLISLSERKSKRFSTGRDETPEENPVLKLKTGF